jgi:uncharacterized protein (DUF2461 family)
MSFDGFRKETMRFLAGLRDHNKKEWFEAHREAYEGAFLAPAIAFAEALAPPLRKIDPDVTVEPRVPTCADTRNAHARIVFDDFGGGHPVPRSGNRRDLRRP